VVFEVKYFKYTLFVLILLPHLRSRNFEFVHNEMAKTTSDLRLRRDVVVRSELQRQSKV